MRKLTKPPTTKNPPEQFTGDVWLDPIASPQDGDQRMTVALVRFAPGARTAWHRHPRGQTLHVVSGVALMGTRDGEVLRVVAGETAYCPPGEDHWHGATPDDFMEHLAMLEAGDGAAGSATWFEHVSVDEYQHAASGR
jgi:quercetin dioxygenase-like cupin family protein